MFLQCDVFHVDAVSLEDLQRILIGHDGKGHGAGIFIDKVCFEIKSNEYTTVTCLHEF